MKRRWPLLVALAGAALLSSGCGAGSTATSSTFTSTEGNGRPPALNVLVDGAAPLRRFSLGTDRLGVWVCHIPVGITDPIYNPVDFRLPLDAGKVTAQLTAHVTPYFDTLSNGNYHPEFVVGGEVSISKSETNRDCVDKAQQRSAADIDGLIVIADAEHAETQHGGWGRPGEPCAATEACPARTSGRAAYIGASDFHPDWGVIPAVDLLEHEIGHTLGFPHSGGGDGYTSAIDLMSNSAAPRDTDPDRRDGPATIAVNLLAAGWIPVEAATIVEAPGTFPLAASNSATGPRVLVLPLDGYRFLTVEALDATGFDDHLPQSGVVVHEIDQTPTTCGSGAATRPCQNEYRTQLPLSGKAPYTDLLGAGSTWSGRGWSIKVAVDGGGGWSVTVGKTD
jgi:hypothetical protein